MTVLPYQHKASIVASVLTVIEIFQISGRQERAPITLLLYFIAIHPLWPGVRASARWFALAKLIIFSKCKSAEFYTTPKNAERTPLSGMRSGCYRCARSLYRNLFHFASAADNIDAFVKTAQCRAVRVAHQQHTIDAEHI